MARDTARDPNRSFAERGRRVVIWGFIIAVPLVPAAVALAMIVSGNVGR
jgi:hypothetical protein